MRNIKLTLQYDGTAYHGWQIQPNALTVQEVVENSIKSIIGTHIHVTGCGRTDSGVHADKYICNFFSDTVIPIDKMANAINSKLPPDIVCKAAQDMPSEFHSKNSAVKKRYTYRILNSAFNDAFIGRYTWHYRGGIDVEAMQKAAAHFVGEHDFAGFASSGLSVKTTVRTIYSIDVTKNNDIISIDVTGNGFLYNMVRIIAGTLLFVGIGKLKAEDIPDIIASCDRNRAGITAPPEGLCLSEVYYRKEDMY